MTGTNVSEKFLKDYLKDIVSFMLMSADYYDKELLGEARRLAACIKAMVYDGAGSRSVMGRLGRKDISFLDFSPDYNPNLGLPFSGAAIVTLGAKTARYVPRLGNDERIGCKKASFDAWWGKPIIVDTGKNVNMSRESVVLAVAASNTGLVHAKLTGAFDGIVERGRSAGINLMSPVNTEIAPIEHASARHIAFELLESLHEEAPEYF